MKKYLIIGIVIRVIVSLTTYHSDTQFFMLANHMLVFKNLWLGFYDYLGSTPEPLSQLIPPEAFTYPPLAILTNGIMARIFYSFISPTYLQTLILDPASQFSNPGFYWALALTKLPFLLPDLVCGWLLTKLFSTKYKLSVWKIWMLNPIAIYATYGMGMFDIYPTLATVASIWFLNQKQSYRACVALGIGAAYKVFPILFLPYLACKVGKTITQKLLLLGTGIGVYLAVLLPYLPSWGFRTYALLAPQSQKLLFAKINITGAEYLSVFFVGYILIIGYALINQIKVWKVFAAILVLFFSVTHYHPQWMIWLTPWMIYSYFTEKHTYWSMVIFLLCYLAIVFSFESSLNYGLPIFFHDAPKLLDLIPVAFEPLKYVSVIRSVAAAVGFLYVLQLFKTNYKPTQ